MEKRRYKRIKRAVDTSEDAEESSAPAETFESLKEKLASVFSERSGTQVHLEELARKDGM